MLLAPEQVVMIWDLARKDGPGAYGEGLAAPLGEMRWLEDVRSPVTFRRLHMGEHGDLRFPYHLLKHEVNFRLLSLCHALTLNILILKKHHPLINARWKHRKTLPSQVCE